MDEESRAIVAVLEALGRAHHRFFDLIREVEPKLAAIQTSKPDLEFWIGVTHVLGVCGIEFDCHLPTGSLGWHVTVDWRSEPGWLVSNFQTWNFFRPYDGQWNLREAERRATDAAGLCAAIDAAVADVVAWVAATTFTGLDDPHGVDPRHSGAWDEIRRRLGVPPPSELD